MSRQQKREEPNLAERLERMVLFKERLADIRTLRVVLGKQCFSGGLPIASVNPNEIVARLLDLIDELLDLSEQQYEELKQAEARYPFIN